MAKKNRVIRISLMGGLLGALFTNPRQALDDELEVANNGGWNAIHIETHNTANLFIWAVQILVLLMTFGLWTWGAGYLVLLEKDS